MLPLPGLPLLIDYCLLFYVEGSQLHLQLPLLPEPSAQEGEVVEAVAGSLVEGSVLLGEPDADLSIP